MSFVAPFYGYGYLGSSYVRPAVLSSSYVAPAISYVAPTYSYVAPTYTYPTYSYAAPVYSSYYGLWWWFIYLEQKFLSLF